MITKTRLQFLAALFLAFLPFLGFPIWLDTILVSSLGIFIAFTTFLTARERRLKSRSANMVEPLRELSVTEEKPKKIKRQTIRKKSKIVEKEESKKNAEQKLDDKALSLMNGAEKVSDNHLLDVVDGFETEDIVSEKPDVLIETKKQEIQNQDVTDEYRDSIPSPLSTESVVKKVTRRKTKTPVFVSDSEDSI